MNWKLILLLSLFGLAMAIATVFVIPSSIEPVCWLIIFIICAILIAKFSPGKYFLTGLVVSLLNAVWITSFHIILFDSYMATHPEQSSMIAKMPFPDHPKLLMLMTGPVIGILSGLILGLFAFIASRIFRKKEA